MKFNNLRKLYQLLLHSSKGWVIINIVYSFACGLAVFAMPRINRNIFVLLTQNGQINRVRIFIIIYFLLMMGFGSTGNFENLLLTKVSGIIERRLKRDFISNVYNIPQDRINSTSFQNKKEYILSHIEEIAEGPISFLNGISLTFAVFITIALSLIRLSIGIIIYIIGVSIFLTIANTIITDREIRMEEETVPSKRLQDYYLGVLTSIESGKEIRSNHNNAWIINNMVRAGSEYIDTFVKTYRKNVLYSTVIEVIEELIPYITAIYMIVKIEEGRVTPGDAVFIYNIVGIFKWTTKEIITLFTRKLKRVRSELDKYIEFCETEKKNSEDNRENESCVNPPKFKKLKLVDVEYTYGNSRDPALKKINIEINKGDKICILGKNGSGKTTLAKIIVGVLSDYSGHIYINGENIKDISKENYSKLFGVVFQNYSRFKFSIKDNIGMGYIENIDNIHEIQEAAIRAKAEYIIKKVPDGMYQMLGKDLYENGVDLSGGEWQRLAMSRSFMSGHDILLLDEPDSSVDPIYEEEVINKLLERQTEETVIIITHNLNVAQKADRIILMEKGELVEDGSFKDLMSKKTRFQEIMENYRRAYRQV